MNFSQMAKYDIRIRHTANNAIIVKVGCAEFAYTSPKDMLLQLAEFYADPEKVEKAYNEFVGNLGPQEVESAPDGPRVNVLGVGTTQPVPEPEPQEEVEQTDDEEAPRLATNRFNLADSEDIDISDASEEEIVELELGDLEDILEAEAETESELDEIESDILEEEFDLKKDE